MTDEGLALGIVLLNQFREFVIFGEFGEDMPLVELHLLDLLDDLIGDVLPFKLADDEPESLLQFIRSGIVLLDDAAEGPEKTALFSKVDPDFLF